MLSNEAKQVAARAREQYERTLRESLEKEHHGKYICIEPVSGDHFMGGTFDEAVNLAIDAYPDRLTHTLRIGFPAALHLGAAYQ